MKRKGNRIEIAGDVALVHMHGAKVCIIDAADVPLVQEHTWFVHRTGYVVTNMRVTGSTSRRQRSQSLHRHLLGLPCGANMDIVVDHLSRDKLDNRRSNLEATSQRENTVRGGLSTLKIGKTSRFVGVCWHARTNSWQAGIFAGGNRYFLGRHACEEAAAEAYRRARSLVDSGAVEAAWTGADLRRAVGVS